MWEDDIIIDERSGLGNSDESEIKQARGPLNKPILVIDTNAFIKCLDLQSLHDKYELYTTAEVKFEIRDKKARDKFAALPFDILVKEPSKTGNSAARKFATATGDIASLSTVDLKVIALCYTFAENNNTASLLRKEPSEIKEAFTQKQNIEEDAQEINVEENAQEINVEEKAQEMNEEQNNNDEDFEDEDSPKKKDEADLDNDDGGWNVVPVKEEKKKVDKVRNEFGSGWNYTSKDIVKVQEKERKEKSKEKPEESDDEDDDGVGWINSNNLHLYKDQGSSKCAIDNEKLGVSIMTADFAMQNVALQMGIPLVSIDGMLITRAKRFILECFACLNLVKDMTKSFCPKCGNHSLLKVSCSFESDGSIKLFRKKGFKINTAGFIFEISNDKQYSIPKPKIGKNADNLILKEDELMRGNKLTQVKIAQKQQEKEFNRNMMEFENGFTLGDVKHKQHVNTGLQFGYGNINPNNVSQTSRYKKN